MSNSSTLTILLLLAEYCLVGPSFFLVYSCKMGKVKDETFHSQISDHQSTSCSFTCEAKYGSQSFEIFWGRYWGQMAQSPCWRAFSFVRVGTSSLSGLLFLCINIIVLYTESNCSISHYFILLLRQLCNLLQSHIQSKQLEKNSCLRSGDFYHLLHIPQQAHTHNTQYCILL